MQFIKHKSFFLLTLSYFSLVSFIGLYFYVPDTNVIDNLSDFNLDVYSDKQEGGNSTAQYTIQKDQIVFSYELKQGVKKQNPYASFTIQPKSGKLLELEGYSIKVAGAIQGVNQVIFRLAVEQSESDGIDKIQSRIYNQKILHTKEGRFEEEFSVNELQVPWWWMKKNGGLNADFPDNSYNKTVGITINNAPVIPLDQKSVVTIKELMLKPDRSLFFTFLLLSVVLFVLIYVLYYIRFLRDQNLVKVPIVVTKSEDNSENEDQERILNYLAEHYKEPSLSLTKMEDDLNLRQRKIPDFLKERFDCTFKQYLNYLRITEAKRLLLTTELQIKEVSYTVGYENQQHFMRVFKELESCTPSDFRKKGK